MSKTAVKGEATGDGASTLEAPPVSIPPDLYVQDVLRKARERFYRDNNVIGVGINVKRVAGEVRPNQYAVVVYVVQKLSEQALDADNVVPETFMGIQTDVVEPLGADGRETAADYLFEHHVMHDMGSIDWARLHELTLRDEEPIVEHAVTVQDFGDVCVIEDDGTLVKTTPAGQQYVDFVRAYQLFRTRHGDDYEHVTFVTDSASGLPPQGGASFWSGVYNDVQGIGLGAFNGRAVWGTSRLQGFHFLNQGHFPIWRYVMLQEWAHQFAAFARYRDPATGATMTDHLLGGVLGHWALNLDDEKSPMDYDVNDRATTRSRTGSRSRTSARSPRTSRPSTPCCADRRREMRLIIEFDQTTGAITTTTTEARSEAPAEIPSLPPTIGLNAGPCAGAGASGPPSLASAAPPATRLAEGTPPEPHLDVFRPATNGASVEGIDAGAPPS